jgi:hypothetical protein
MIIARKLGLLLGAALLTMGCQATTTRPGSGAVSASTPEGDEIPYLSEVTLSVGEQAPIHGSRGRCGEAPPDFDTLRLPDLAHGSLVAGDMGWRRSRSCGGPTPAREVIYVAESSGTDSFLLFGDPVTVTVE